MALLFAAATAGNAWAHPEGTAAAPDADGATVSFSAALRTLRAHDRLPSQGLPGHLLRGDTGVDHRGGELEHASALLGYRFTPTLAAKLALGAHGRDPVHVEAAWLEGRGRYGDHAWTWGAGRQGPSLGSVFSRAGHIDTFGLMPLAKAAVLDGDWIDDGTEWSLQRQGEALGWRVDAGLWSGRKFPGNSPGRVFPSLHAGARWDAPMGDLSMDAFAASLRPDGRGSRISTTPGGHTHTAPVCDDRLQEVVCFDGRSRVAGLSARWSSPGGSVTLTGAALWRKEQGRLESRNGIGQYSGHTRGGWWDATWRPAHRWELGLRHEQLSARQALVGPGATLVAAEAGLNGYAPQRRLTGMAGYALLPWAQLRTEWGREVAGGPPVHFASLRLVLQWERNLAATAESAALPLGQPEGKDLP